MAEVRETLTIRVNVMSRPLRLDEVGFECFRGDAPFPAVVLTDYAEVTTENGQKGGKAGDFVVDGPDGIEVLSGVEFGQKFTYESASVLEAEDDPGFVQDLDAAQADENPKGVTVSGDTPGDQVEPVEEESDGTEVGGENEAPSDGSEPDEPPAETPEVSEFDALDDNALWEVANDLEIVASSVSRAELIALIDAKVAEASDATEATE